MTAESNGHPTVIEGPGRYAVYQAPDGGYVVARAVGICDNCRACGCGDQADPIVIPAMLLRMAEQASKSGMNPMAMLKAVRRG